MKKLRVGIIGGGSIARRCHVPGYAADADCELTAIADVNAPSLELMRREFRFGHEYADFRTMLEREKLDVVSVCTPNKFHAEAAIAALETSCDVLLEKPVAMTMAEGEAIRAAVGRSGKRLAVCFSHRFNDLVRITRKALDEGRVGAPYMIRVRFAHNGPQPGWATTEWFYKPELSGGGAMLDMAVHAVDLIHYLIGPVTAISAITATLRKPIAVDDNVVAGMKLGDRCLGYLECGWTSPAGFTGIEVMGDNGALVADYNQGKVVAHCGATAPDGSFAMHEEVLGTSRNSHWTVQMAELIDQLKHDRPLATSIDDGLAALKVTLGAYESSRTGKQVNL